MMRGGWEWVREGKRESNRKVTKEGKKKGGRKREGRGRDYR